MHGLDLMAIRESKKPEKLENFENVISVATMHPMIGRMCLH